MADIQHVNITDPNIHEPKGVASADINTVYLADGTGSGEWVSTRTLQLSTLWEHHVDGQYTSTAPLSLVADTRTKLTNDGTGGSTLFSHLSTALWDTSTNLIKPAARGDAYSLRLQFKVLPSVANGYVGIEVDSNGEILVAEDKSYLRGAVPQSILASTDLFALTNFVDNGAGIYLTSSIAADVYDITLLLVRTYKA